MTDRRPGHPLLRFQDLMPYRVHDILLVSSLYDSFTLQEDGRLHDEFLGEFLEMNLHRIPGLTQVSSGAEALRLAREQSRFNLIITTPHLRDMDAALLARRVKEAGLCVPVIVLGYDNRELLDFVERKDTSAIDRIFLWQGTARILLAIVKYIEDKQNVAHDTFTTGVRVVLVVEDSIRFYSSFLPMIYTVLIGQSRRLVEEGISLSHKLLRMRARPKILLCTSFEEAWEAFSTYREYLLGILSDISFPREGKMAPEAGFALTRMARRAIPDLPILLQSSRPELAERARALRTSFALKHSPTLLTEVQTFVMENFAFGDFVFRLPDGREVDRAPDMRTLEEKLLTVPEESLAYHAERNHFSTWLMARTEFALARLLRPRHAQDYPTLQDMRMDLVETIREYRREQAEAMVADFDRRSFDPGARFFSRIGAGSLGGKARALAFVRYLLHLHGVRRKFPGVEVAVPPAVVLATDVFDQFLAENDLLDFALRTGDDEAIVRRFLKARFPDEFRRDLEAFLRAADWPIAVRSSSLLEDSQQQPFAGVYETYMVPNDHPGVHARLEQLLTAVKRVYASTFSQRAKAFLEATPYRLEEEKMAVILQKVVGHPHHHRYYPDFSGVARSHNFYPQPPARAEDGIASVALGLCRTVVEGGQCVTFSPRYPRHLPGFSSVEDVLANTQREFWALVLHRDPSCCEERFGLEAAEEDGTLHAVGSRYSPEDHAVHDGLSRHGVPLVTFAPILKHGVFPLAEILKTLLEIGSEGMNRPVEIEFAVRLTGPEPREFGFVQIRPMVLTRESEELRIAEEDPSRILCRSLQVMGHGVYTDIQDLVVVDFHRFDRSRSREAAEEVARHNARLTAKGRPYILIGVGRWGSTDPWLGIPVTWDQISGARVIVEAGFRDFKITPSQGSHFFQNLNTFQIGYLTVNPEAGEGYVDWEWLERQGDRDGQAGVHHLRLERPAVVKIDGRTGEGVIYKPAPGQ